MSSEQFPPEKGHISNVGPYVMLKLLIEKNGLSPTQTVEWFIGFMSNCADASARTRFKKEVQESIALKARQDHNKYVEGLEEKCGRLEAAMRTLNVDHHDIYRELCGSENPGYTKE